MSLHRTKIPYATHAANWQAGCSHTSVGCEHCWAEAMARRLAANPSAPAHYHRGIIGPNGRWSGRIAWSEHEFARTWDAIGRLRQPATIFLGDMTDLFHEAAPEGALDALAHALEDMVDRRAPVHRHRYLLVTKRPDRLRAWQERHFPDGLPERVIPIVSCSTQADVDLRVPDLIKVRAVHRGVSLEPLLDLVDLRPEFAFDDGTPAGYNKVPIQWVIVGGESGPGARPMRPEWARSLRDQCRAAGAAFFYKQDGGLHGGGHLLDGAEHREVPHAD